MVCGLHFGALNLDLIPFHWEIQKTSGNCTITVKLYQLLQLNFGQLHLKRLHEKSREEKGKESEGWRR